MAKPYYKNARRNDARKPDGKSGYSKQGSRRPDPSASPESRPAKQTPVVIARTKPGGNRLPEKTSVVLEAKATADYALIDSGGGEKLERYGKLLIRRPEGQAIWLPTLSEHQWARADAVFTGDTDEEGIGRWHFPNKPLHETWELAFDGMPFHGRFTSFRHTGVFPEQAAHWTSLQNVISKAQQPVRMLNLFGYTGIASLVAARAGAQVTHVDASKKAIGWARENQQLAGLGEHAVRWICDDATKFCAREVRRGQSYDIILLDPPAYGRGPKGEIWQLFDHLPHMLDLVRELQSKTPVMTILTSYAIRASSFAIHEIMQEVFAGMAGRLESGELILRQESNGGALSTSMFSRFIGDGVQP